MHLAGVLILWYFSLQGSLDQMLENVIFRVTLDCSQF